MIYNENLYRRNVYQLHHVFDENSIRPISYFQNLGLNSEEIVYVWRICDVILKSGTYITGRWFLARLIRSMNIFV